MNEPTKLNLKPSGDLLCALLNLISFAGKEPPENENLT